MRHTLSFGLIFFVGGAAWAQTAQGGFTMARPSSMEPAVKDAPYTAEMHLTGVSPSRNGIPGNENRVVSKVFRDSQGRIRQEGLDTTGSTGPRLVITLMDAAAARECFLDTEGKVAHCFSSIRTQPFQFPSDATLEDLGSKFIEGVRAEGKRYTQPASNVTSEAWISPELQMVMQTEQNTSGGGKFSIAVVNLRREEAPANMFEIPADYRIVNETGDRAVIYGAPAESGTAGASRPGNGVSQPKLLQKVEPKYTKEASRAKIEGTVTISMVVGVDGRATDFKIVKSLDKGLDQEAIKAIEKWRFQPGEKEGKPVPVLANVEVNFRLLDSPPQN